MDLILCHTTADFDALGAAVGLTRLSPGSKIVLTGGAHPTVKDFLALHRDEYPFIERRAVNPAQIRSLTVVDTQQRDRLGKAAEWFDLADLPAVVVYDHHLEQGGDIPATEVYIEPVGASTTIIVEKLQQAQITLSTADATVMALGIHVDTGSLTFEMSTARDALALGWLMEQGASLSAIREYIEPGLSPLKQLLADIAAAVPQPLTARKLMSAPIRTIRPETTIGEAQRTILRYGHSGLPIVDDTGRLAGIISRRDLDIALHHGFSHAPVKGYMTIDVKTITPDTSLSQIEALMVTYDIGRLPVLEHGQLVGIVTRTDVLRELHQGERGREDGGTVLRLRSATRGWGDRVNLQELEDQLAPQLWNLLMQAALAAEQRGWHLYLVGGAVRDLLLATGTNNLLIKDIDLVVDGFHQAADVGAGVEIAKVLQQLYPAARLDIHGAFQTAALLWHQDPTFDSLWVDIATARTEFYPYPAANPIVEASSIRQDLYRRDFTINALALRLTPDRSTGTESAILLDFFGGLVDLQAKQIRVLHPNSFIEDPTRIYRGVRFAVRLGFAIEPQTEAYIRYAINSGVYDRTSQENQKTPALQTRLKTELKYLLQSAYWQPALELLSDLGALQCIHVSLTLDRELLRQLRLLARCLRRFDARKSIGDWQLRLEVIIAHLAPEYRSPVAKNLQLSVDSIDRLEKLEQVESSIEALLPTFQRVSEIVRLLRQYNLSMLILIAVRCGDSSGSYSITIRRQIWRYLTIWSNVQPILTGEDLRRLGYKPGPQYREILEEILTATLDGVITDKVTAEKFLLSCLDG